MWCKRIKFTCWGNVVLLCKSPELKPVTVLLGECLPQSWTM